MKGIFQQRCEINANRVDIVYGVLRDGIVMQGLILRSQVKQSDAMNYREDIIEFFDECIDRYRKQGEDACVAFFNARTKNMDEIYIRNYAQTLVDRLADAGLV